VRVLIVEDQPTLADDIADGLRDQGMAADVAYDGATGLDKALMNHYDVVIVDRDLPRIHGDAVCAALVGAGTQARILMLTARDLIDDRVAGLDAGADDYLIKPFALAELRARLRALLRRNGASAEQLSYSDVVLDLAGARVTRGGWEVSLTRTEYLLLELFLRNPDRVLSHSQIFQAVWGYDFGPRSNNLWVYVSYLRSKLEAGGEPRLLHTVRGLGYVLRDAP